MQYPKRIASVLRAVGFLGSLLPAHAARAQSCHPAPLREPTETGFRAGFAGVVATFSDVEHGAYQGVVPTLGWQHSWVTAELALPWYRLERDGQEAIGLGDLAANVRVPLYRADSGVLAFGPELAVSFPTGDADKELGMGHVMAMPGGWARLEVEKLSIMAQLAWGGALANSGAHAQLAGHAGHESGATHPSPRVNPMNMTEFEHALGVRYALHPNLAVTWRWLGAVPLDDIGIERQMTGPGLRLAADALDTLIEVLVPVAGDPFDVRVSVSFGAQP